MNFHLYSVVKRLLLWPFFIDETYITNSLRFFLLFAPFHKNSKIVTNNFVESWESMYLFFIVTRSFTRKDTEKKVKESANKRKGGKWSKGRGGSGDFMWINSNGRSRSRWYFVNWRLPWLVRDMALLMITTSSLPPSLPFSLPPFLPPPLVFLFDLGLERIRNLESRCRFGPSSSPLIVTDPWIVHGPWHDLRSVSTSVD